MAYNTAVGNSTAKFDIFTRQPIADVPYGERPYKCPVCNGMGEVMNGFYMQTSGYWTTSNTSTEPCRSCNGTGVLWE